MLDAAWLARLRDRFEYEPETGIVRWKNPPHRNLNLKGKVAGTSTGKYSKIRFEGRAYLYHRIIWVLLYGKWPKEQLDHIDGDPQNNKLDNLREATPSQNSWNKKSAKSSGLKGTCFDIRQKTKPWKTAIMLDHKLVHLGYYATEQEAHAIYREAAKKHFGKFARFE